MLLLLLLSPSQGLCMRMGDPQRDGGHGPGVQAAGDRPREAVGCLLWRLRQQEGGEPEEDAESPLYLQEG